MLTLLLACTPAGDDSAAKGADVYEPAPYIVPEEDPPVAAFSAAELEGAIAESLDLATGLRGSDVFPSYFAAMEGADDDCPNYYETDGNVYWYDVCTSSYGSQFNGYSFYYYYDHYDAGDGSFYTGHAVAGVAQVWDAEDHLFEAGGTAYDLRVDGDTFTYWYSVAQGAFSYDGPEAEGTWLEQGLSPDMVQTVYYATGADAKGYVLQGSVSGLSGSFTSAVYDGVQIFDEALVAYAGGNCALEPSGVVSLRDVDGAWYDVLFDGYTEARPLTPEGMCDGCGEAYFRGDAVGQVCVDFTGLNSWEGAPW